LIQSCRPRGVAFSVLGSIVAALLTACSPSAPSTPTTAPKPTTASDKPAASPGAAPAGSPSASPAASPAAGAPAANTSASTVDPSLASVWQGKTVTIVVAEAPGGGYDNWGRLVGRHLGKQLPGKPTIIVENMPGGSHRIGTNHVYQSKPDGLTIGLVDRFIPGYQLRGEGPEEGVRYDANKLNWLGSTATETQVLTVTSKPGVTSWKDLATKDVKIGHTGPGSSPHTYQLLLNKALNLKSQPIFGYNGTASILLGMDRGEVDGIVISYSSLAIQRADDLTSKALIPLVQFGDARIKDPLSGMPPAADELFKDATPEYQQLLSLAQRPFTWSRAFVLPPSMDAKMLSTMRAAFMNTTSDPEFLADARQLKFDVDAVSGEQVQSLIEEYMQTPRPIVDRLTELIEADTPH
jgi:tripartite-type tricarboxylate transporter receptor subunit TctC